MLLPPEAQASFFSAVRADDASAVRSLLAQHPDLARARWPGRSGDGKMRSLGPPPYNQHTWLSCPPGHSGDDPRFTSTPLIYSRNDDIVRLLVEAGADVNARGTSGDVETPDWFYTPLWRAAHDGRTVSVRLLVERGADINYLSPDGSSQALKTAAENDRTAVCEYLLAHAAEPDLITAAMLGLPEKARQLVARDPAAIHQRDAHGRSALDAATLLDTFRSGRRGLGENHDRVARILIEHGANLELEHAASLGMLAELRRLVENTPDAFQRPRIVKALLGGAAIKESALQAARRRGHAAVVGYLIEKGAEREPGPVVR